MSHKLAVLIAAAGKGTRSGLPYPKTLYSIKGKPILIRQLELFSEYDPCPTIIVSPSGEEAIQLAVAKHNRRAHFVKQEAPIGMGDAVLSFQDSAAYKDAEHIILAWGDIPFIQKSTLDDLVTQHLNNSNDFSFPSKFVDKAYTKVIRDLDNQVKKVIETRENKSRMTSGERDIGLFIFRKKLVIDQLKIPAELKYSKASGEHGFLYIIEELVKKGLKVEAFDIATKLDLISLNKISDLDHLTP